MTPVEIAIAAAAALFGATLGSFLNVCIWRLPRPGLSVVSPRRSHCPACGAPIPWFDNIPLWSWLWIGGRCRSCRASISARYFAVEALTAALFAILAARYLTPGELRWAEFAVLAALAAALIVVSFIDIDLRILPDEITIRGMLLVPIAALGVPDLHTRPVDPWVWRLMARLRDGLGVAGNRLGMLPDAGPAFWGIAVLLAAIGAAAGLFGFHGYWRLAHPRNPNRLRDGALAAVLAASAAAIGWLLLRRPSWALSPPVLSYAAALLGMGTGAGLVFLAGVGGKLIFHKEAMGFGDVKLMGLLGGFAGWAGVLGGFAIACLLGSVVGLFRLAIYRTRYIWFGPFLSLGCLLVILFPEPLRGVLEWYLKLFR